MQNNRHQVPRIPFGFSAEVDTRSRRRGIDDGEKCGTGPLIGRTSFDERDEQRPPFEVCRDTQLSDPAVDEVEVGLPKSRSSRAPGTHPNLDSAVEDPLSVTVEGITAFWVPWSTSQPRYATYDPPMPRLIHLNGPPRVGKSTLARRYANEHPGVLALDLDVLAGLIGGRKEDFSAALEMARGHGRDWPCGTCVLGTT